MANLAFGQITTFKIKKTSDTPRLTIAMADTGFVTLDQILTDKKMTIVNATENIKIRFYDAAVTNGGQPIVFSGQNSRLTKKIINELKRDGKTKVIGLTIFNIIGFNDSNETIHFNDIRLKVLK